MKNQTTAEIIDLMQKQFAKWGIPDEIVTDSGTNYDSAEFSQFCQRKEHQAHHIITKVMAKLSRW